MKLLIDEQLPPNLAHALDQLVGATHSFSHVRDHFGPGTPDEQVIDFAVRGGWHLLTHDKQLSRNAIKRAALRQQGVRMFVLTGRSVRTLPRIGAFVLNRIDDMVKWAEDTNGPFICSVPDRGGLENLD